MVGQARPGAHRETTEASMQIDMNTADISKKNGFNMPWHKHKHLADDQDFTARLPIVQKLPPGVRGHVVAIIGEAVGTFLFLFFAFAATLNANATTDQIVSKNLYISLGFAFSLVVNAWIFFRVSGGLFNPAVTWGMCLVGAITWLRGLFLFITQIVGALIAAALARALFPADLNVQTALADGTSLAQGFFLEMLLTIQLVLAIFLLAAEKNQATFLAPIGIGLALFVAELAGVRYTGGSLNPARSFAPAAINGSFNSYHWIYWIGPLLGSTVAAFIYKLIKMLDYETANPAADKAGDQHGNDQHDHEEHELGKRATHSSRGHTHNRHTSNDEYSGSSTEHHAGMHPERSTNGYTAGSDLENGQNVNGGLPRRA